MPRGITTRDPINCPGGLVTRHGIRGSSAGDCRLSLGANFRGIELLASCPITGSSFIFRRSAHRDRTTADVVVTRPGEPSALEGALAECGFATGLMEITSEAFGDLATSATKHFT